MAVELTGPNAGNRTQLNISGTSPESMYGITSKGTDLFLGDTIKQAVIKLQLCSANNATGSVYSSNKAGSKRGSGTGAAGFGLFNEPALGLTFIGDILYAATLENIIKVDEDGNRTQLLNSLIKHYIHLTTDNSSLFSFSLKSKTIYKIDPANGNSTRQSIKAGGTDIDIMSNMIYVTGTTSLNGLWILDNANKSLIRWSNPEDNKWTSETWSKAP